MQSARSNFWLDEAPITSMPHLPSGGTNAVRRRVRGFHRHTDIGHAAHDLDAPVLGLADVDQPVQRHAHADGGLGAGHREHQLVGVLRILGDAGVLEVDRRAVDGGRGFASAPPATITGNTPAAASAAAISRVAIRRRCLWSCPSIPGFTSWGRSRPAARQGHGGTRGGGRSGPWPCRSVPPPCVPPGAPSGTAHRVEHAPRRASESLAGVLLEVMSPGRAPPGRPPAGAGGARAGPARGAGGPA